MSGFDSKHENFVFVSCTEQIIHILNISVNFFDFFGHDKQLVTQPEYPGNYFKHEYLPKRHVRQS
jgi:hypothetical protein